MACFPIHCLHFRCSLSPSWQQAASCFASPRPRAAAGSVSPLCMGVPPQAFHVWVPVFDHFHKGHMCVWEHTIQMGNLSTRRTFNIWYALYIICKSGWVALFRAEWFRVGVWGARPKALHAFGSGRHRAHLALMRLLESSCSMISAPDHFFPVSAFPVAIPICHGVYVGNCFKMAVGYSGWVPGGTFIQKWCGWTIMGLGHRPCGSKLLAVSSALDLVQWLGM